MNHSLLFATVLLLPLLAGPLIGQTKPNRLDHTKLLVYQDDDGKPQPVKTTADWQKRKAAVLQAMQEVMGPLPGKVRRCPLDVKIEEEVDCGSFVRRLISYASEPGQRVPAYLLVPKSALNGKKAAAVLSLHPTHAQGLKVTVRLAHYPNAAHARELADPGFGGRATPSPPLATCNPDIHRQ